MIISKAWTVPGYIIGGMAAQHYGGWTCYFIILASFLWIDMTSWASARK